MSVHPTKKILIGGVLITIALGADTASATTYYKDVSGNPTCATVGNGFTQLKIDPVKQGRSTFNDGRLSGSVNVSGVRFDWSSNQGVDAVIVKGGPNARIYRRSTEVSSGTGLTAPINPNNGTPYGLSHITFCYDVSKCPPKPTPTPTPTPSPTPTPTPRPNPTPTPTPTPSPTPTPTPPPKPTPTPTPSPSPTPTPSPSPTPTPSPSPTPTPPPNPSPTPTPTTTPIPEPTPTTTPTPEPPASPTPPASTDTPRGEVLGATEVAARSRMTSPARCVSRSFKQVVRGTGIKRVTFSVNGRRVSRITGTRSAYSVSIDPRKQKSGRLTITARVEYVAASGKRAQTLRSTVLRCSESRSTAKPRFAG